MQESGVDPNGDVLAVKPAAAAIGVGYLRARGAEEAMEAAKAMLDQACAARFRPTIQHALWLLTMGRDLPP